jgi:hypothetical protein
MAIWLRTGRPRSRDSIPGRGNIFLYYMTFRPALRSIQPPVQWVPVAVSPGIKQQGREADHLSPSSAEVKNVEVLRSLSVHLNGAVLN